MAVTEPVEKRRLWCAQLEIGRIPAWFGHISGKRSKPLGALQIFALYCLQTKVFQVKRGSSSQKSNFSSKGSSASF